MLFVLNAFTGVHILCILVSIIMLFVLLAQKPSKVLNEYLCCVFSIFIYMAAYLVEMCALDLSTLLAALKLRYIGQTLALFFYLWAMMDFCGVRKKKPAIILAFLNSIFILGVVYTNEKHLLYYSDYHYANNGYFAYLETSHGVLYTWQMITTMLIEVSGAAVCGWKYWREKNRVKQKCYLLCIVAALLPAAALSVRSMPLYQGYNVVMVGLLGSAVCLFVAITQYNMLDITETAKSAVVDYVSDGIILLDADGYVLYCNSVAAQWFPEVREAHYLEDPFHSTLQDGEKGDFSYRERHYSYSVNQVHNGRTMTGFICRLTDDTHDYEYKQQLTREVEEKAFEIYYIQNEMISGIANIIESRDGNTGEHVKKTSEMVGRILDKMIEKGIMPELITQEYRDTLVKAAVLHDIGKIKVPDAILSKPGPLTPQEYEVIKRHAQEGADIIRSVMGNIEGSEYIEMASEVALYHHERWDGTGYPKGLAGEKIPLGARIMAVADVYDALISERCYKKALPQEEAIRMMQEEKGSHFDPMLIDIFCELMEDEVAKSA